MSNKTDFYFPFELNIQNEIKRKKRRRSIFSCWLYSQPKNMLFCLYILVIRWKFSCVIFECVCVCLFTFYIDANRMKQLFGLMMNLLEFLCCWIKLYEVRAKVKHDGITNVNNVLPNISNEMKRRCNKKEYKPTNKFPVWIDVYDTQVHKQTRFDPNLWKKITYFTEQ